MTAQIPIPTPTIVDGLSNINIHYEDNQLIHISLFGEIPKPNKPDK